MAVEWRGADEIEAALPFGLELSAKALLDNTLPKVPEDQGDLRASGFATVDGDVGTVGFGTEYGVIQHQRTRYRHDVGEAKFLANAAGEFVSEFEQIMAAEIRRASGG